MKVTGGSIIVSDTAVDASTVTGGGIVIADGPITVNTLTGGGVLISSERIEVKRAHAAAGVVSAPEVTVREGSVRQIQLRHALTDERVRGKLQYASEQEQEQAKAITGASSDSTSSVQQSRSPSRDDLETERYTTEEKWAADTQEETSDETATSTVDDSRSKELEALDDVDLPDEEIAAVVVADVLGLFCEDSHDYHQDKLILLAQHPELEHIMDAASSVDEAIDLAERHERLSFTDEQIDIMHSDEKLVQQNGVREVEFEELLY